MMYGVTASNHTERFQENDGQEPYLTLEKQIFNKMTVKCYTANEIELGPADLQARACEIELPH